MEKGQVSRRIAVLFRLRAVVVLIVIVFTGCKVEPETRAAAVVTVKDTIVNDQGACQIVLAVENTGDVSIEQIDIVISVETDTRRYYRRVVDSTVIPPNETIGLVEEIILDSPDETVDTDATNVEWESFS